MGELLVIRHGQAAFGAAEAGDYDQLTDLGQRQARMAGQALRDMGWVADRVLTGTLRRQKQTLAAMQIEAPAQVHGGFDEYDFHDLLRARFGDTLPEPVRKDRKTHFRSLRETLFDWQKGTLDGAGESWDAFAARVEAARALACDGSGQRVLAISSGGVIGQLVARALEAPARQMVALNLQVKNTSFTRFFFSGDRFSLHEFNTTPHFASGDTARYLSYS